MSIRNTVMHEAQRRITWQKKERDIEKPPVPDRVKLGLDAPTDITGPDVLAIDRAKKMVTP